MKYLPTNWANDHQGVSCEKTNSAVKAYKGDINGSRGLKIKFWDIKSRKPHGLCIFKKKI